MSAENGIAAGGRLHAVDEPPAEPKVAWPKGRVPFPTIKNRPETDRKAWNFRGIITTIGEIVGLGAISAGSWSYSHGAGLIVGGMGLFAVSFLSGMPE